MALISIGGDHYVADTYSDMATPPCKEGDSIWCTEEEILYVCNGVGFIVSGFKHHVDLDEGNSTSTYSVEGLSEGNASSEYSILEENIDEGGA